MENKIKILLVSNILGIGGAERTVQTIALYLNRALFDVTVLCLEIGGGRVAALQAAGIPVLIGDGTLEAAKKLVAPGEYDVVHFHRSGHTEPLHTELVKYLRPAKLMETNVFAFADPVLGPGFDLRIYKSLMMLTQRAWRARALDASARPWRQERVIYNPVTVDYFDIFKLTPEERRAKRHRLGITDGDIVIGRNGRNDPVKWGDLLLAALPSMFKKIPNLKCILQTIPASRRAFFERHNYFDNRVIVLPETSDESDIAATYQLLDIYVHTSRRGEAFGNSLNEAMVWGLPIIVENTPHWDNGQMEQVDHGVTGWVVKSAAGLASALEDLVARPERRTAFGAAGRKKVTTEFGLARGLEQYELAYQQLVGQVSEPDLERRMFPSPAAIIHYAAEYKRHARQDFPHAFKPLLTARSWCVRWHWRVYDSLQARGFIKKSV